MMLVGIQVSNVFENDNKPDLQKPNAQIQNVTYGPGLGVSYDEIMTGLGDYIPSMAEPSPLATGEMRRIGKSDMSKAALILEVIGDMPSNVDSASMSFFAVSNNPEINMRNVTAVMIFVRNALPDWPGAPKQVFDTIIKLGNQKVKPGKPNLLQLSHGDKQIKISLLNEMGMFNINIEHNSAQ